MIAPAFHINAIVRPALPARDAYTIWLAAHADRVPFERWEPTYEERQEYMRAARGGK